MELRNRVTGATKQNARGLDVALGPTIYSGERYSKMSERLKRQHKKPSDVADVNTQRIMRSQILSGGYPLRYQTCLLVFLVNAC
ncbi:unnamed protein product [Peronospora belbahrii]|uniref:Uncharacterized protein n=1 Tax=Peronospora belbahrii TaxID=622444 RepID=A0ABN8CMW8_9STRA|nr:unnamed protein product [Peronospora belbahrii]